MDLTVSTDQMQYNSRLVSYEKLEARLLIRQLRLNDFFENCTIALNNNSSQVS